MSDTIIFIVGTGVFALTTTATLLYGYAWFNDKSVEAGVEDGSEEDFDAESEPDPEVSDRRRLLSVRLDSGRIHRPRPLTRSP